MSEEHVSVTRRRTWRLWLLPATAVLVLGVALWAIAVRSRADRASEGRSPAEDAPIAVQSAVVQYERTPVWYEATGTVRPQFETQLAAKVMGRIVRLEVREGDRVTAGQPLVWLDSRDLRAAVSQAAAGARAARVGVDAASTAARMERSSSAARIDAARALVKQSEAAVAAARSRLDLVRNGPRRQERAQAALAVAQAKAALDLAEADYQRMRTLHTEGAVSKQQLDAARTQWEVARARHAAAVEAASMAEEGSREEDIRAAEEGLRQAQAALDAAREGLRQAEAAALMADVRDQEVRSAREQARQAEAALRLAQTTQDHSILQAPYDGVVARRLADPGNMANPGVPLLTIQGGALRVEAVVPESVLRHVAIGGPASVRLDALGDREISGRVVEISPQGDPATHTFIVRVELPAGSGAMAGMFGRVRFTVGREERLVAPTNAIVERDGLQYVFVLSGDKRARLRLVTTGARTADRVAILSGLRQGERIVADPPAELKDGAAVRF